jgi:RNA polymerase sigma-70 factor, ECF subfamily
MDRTAWENLVRERGADLVLYARTWCRSRSDAEDVVQEGIMRCLSIDAPRDEPAAFLFTCIRSAALDWLKSDKRRRHRESVVAAEGTDQALFACSLRGEEVRLAVERALALLPPEQREVVVLRIWGERSFEEISRISGVPMNTAMSRWRYSLAKLRVALDLERLA